MSVSDVLSRITDIQATIAQIQSGSLSSGTDSTSASSASATDFASALAAADPSTDGTSSDSTSALLASLTGTASTDPLDSTVGSAATAASPTGGLVSNGTTGADVLADAKKYLGVPYVFGGTTTSGMDCSGLVQTVFKDLGITMPRVVPDQANMGIAVPSMADAKPGDLIVEKGNGHIQIYAGNGMILEAPKPGENVKLRKEWLTDDQIGSIRRIVPSGAASSASAASSLSSASGASSASQSDLVTAALQQMMSSGASA